MPARKPLSVARAAWLVVLAGGATLILTIAMAAVGGLAKPDPRAHGYSQAMVCFELVRTPDELFDCLGPAESVEGRERRDAMTRVNQIDLAFAFAYPQLALAIVLLLSKLRQGKAIAFHARLWQGAVWLAGLLALVTAPSDLGENGVLFRLAELGAPSDVSPELLHALDRWTSLKWAGLFGLAGLTGLLLVVDAVATRWSLGRLLGLASLVAAALGLRGVFGPAEARPLVEPATMVLSGTWVVMIAVAVVVLRRERANA